MVKKAIKKPRKSARIVVRSRKAYSYPSQQMAYKQQQVPDQGVGYQSQMVSSAGSGGKSPMFMTPAELEEYNPRLPNRHKHGGYPIRHEEALAVAYWLLARKIKKKQQKSKKLSKKTKKSTSPKRAVKKYRMKSHLGVQCADCQNYIRLPSGYMGCKETFVKISKPQSKRKIDCVFFIPTYIEI